MSLRIQNNVEALTAHRSLNATSDKIAKSMERLSSGYRINRAADDAAGLTISEKLRGQIGGLAQANRNTSDAVSLVQTAEGALNEVHSMLQRIRELSVQYKNGSLSSSDRSAIQSEVNQLASEIERIGGQSEFNGIKLMNVASTVTFQVGANDTDVIKVNMLTLTSTNGVGTSYAQLSTTALGVSDLEEIDTAINNVATFRATLGAVSNRLEHSLQAAGAYQENLVAAESRIRDVDMAAEMVNYTKYSILAQAGQSMLAQANQSPQSVLQLLR